MTPERDAPRPAPSLSLADRLRQQYGTEVDPRIDLQAPANPRAAPPSSATTSSPSSPTLARLGGRTGTASRYHLHGEIARGGMGAILEVFDEDLRRRLAMKVILDRRTDGGSTPATAADPVTLARFLEEAQVTGQLDHPGIVPVHELGLDEQGRVYFTMRLVHGRDLESICDLAARGEEGWSTTRVLGVLLKVCEAMAYAHEKGVVHRDLKPQNVMVGRFGEVYVMDWGLARVKQGADRRDLRLRATAVRGAPSPLPAVATDRRDASSTDVGDALCTMDGDVVGTPSYMAPEQARGDLAAVDERSDVYSLGAMLYRLLAGVAPHGGDRSTAVEVWRRVVGGPPQSLESLAPATPPELVAICAKAMAREPAARYADMLALEVDLRAFLEHRVVSAFETGALAEARKWIRRNKGLAASLAAAVLALAAGLIVSLVFAGRARESALVAEQRRVEATANAAAATRQAGIAREVNSFLNDDLLAAIAPEHDGKDVTVRQVLDAASARLEVQGLGTAPEVEAALRLTMGTSYERLGDAQTALQHFERALALGREDGNRSEPVLQAMRGRAAALTQLGRRDESIAQYREALALARDLLGEEHRATLSTMSDLAIVLEAVGRTDEARTLRGTALPVQTRVLGADADDTLTARNNQALADQANGQLAAAEREFRDVLARRRVTSGARHPETLVVMNNLSQVLADMGQLDEGEALAREVLDAYRELHDEDHPKLANAVGNLGTFAFRRGRMAEAEQLFAESLRLRLRRADPDSPETLMARHNLAASIVDPARQQEALQLRREVADARRRILGAKHADTLESMNSVAAALRELDRLDEAEALYRETLALRREVHGDRHPNTLVTMENLGGVLLAKRDTAGSEALTREVLELRREVLGDDHPDVAKTTLNLAIVLRARGDVAGGLQTIDDALARHRTAYGDDHPQVAACLRTRGDLCVDAKDHAQALAAYGEALDISRRTSADESLVGYLLHQIAYAHYQLGDLDRALTRAAEAMDLRARLGGKDGVGARVSAFLHARVLVAQQRLPEAEPIVLDLHERALRLDGAEAQSTKRLRALLVTLYESWDKPTEAAKWR